MEAQKTAIRKTTPPLVPVPTGAANLSPTDEEDAFLERTAPAEVKQDAAL